MASINGSVHVLHVKSADDAQSKEFRGLSTAPSSTGELVKTVESLKAGFGISDPVAINRVLGKQRRDLEAIVALDFFGSPLRDKAERVLAEMEARVRELIFPDKAPASPVGRRRAREPHLLPARLGDAASRSSPTGSPAPG